VTRRKAVISRAGVGGGNQSTSSQTGYARPPVDADDPSTGIDAKLLDLIRRPYFAEILAALDEQPHTLAGLRRVTGAPRRQAIAVLRALAGYQAITREAATTATESPVAGKPTNGSWDTTGDRLVGYRLTGAGHSLVQRLFDLRVWAALYRSDRPPLE